MKSFKEYAQNAPHEQTEPQGTLPDEGASAEELTKKIASSYNGKSNAEILRGILTEAEKSKRAGTLSNAEIDAFYQSFAPMLGAAQRKQLLEVVERLKKL